MALELEQDESVSRAIRRIGRKHARKALKALADCESMEAVHSARKRIKQMRALLRLTRTGVPSSQRRKLTRRLKSAASALAGPRDSFVKAAALKSLKERSRQDVADGALRHIEALLRKQQDQAQHRAARDIRKTCNIFKKICRAFGEIDAKCGGWQIIGCGLKRTYREGRGAYRVALKTERTEDFHEWRKRAKDLYYHVELLCGIWPEQMHAMKQDLEKLGDALGDSHDLSLLTESETLREFPTEARREVELLKKLASRRRRELQMHAFALGEKLYDEKPGAFCGRLKGYWKKWRCCAKKRGQAGHAASR